MLFLFAHQDIQTMLPRSIFLVMFFCDDSKGAERWMTWMNRFGCIARLWLIIRKEARIICRCLTASEVLWEHVSNKVGDKKIWMNQSCCIALD